MMIKEIIRHVEVFTSRSEVDPYVPIKFIKDNNESRLLLELKPFIESQHFRRHADDAGYLESRIWLPYVKDEVMRKLESKVQLIDNYNDSLQKRIDDYNALPWWRKMFGDV